jgi:hypothetical protein
MGIGYAIKSLPMFCGSLSCPRVVDGEDSLQICRVAAKCIE